ncbi:hypothetical protein FZEAL_3687 [Fusarium zealandicum]|uniref:Secreted protein n=1 Tax=Fusarium zealandicum TaxID=1053134 RepID=A0A8H4UN70_9HYPO|nr:hypothetical protein FZEAL_3687 [Fusarium zealandicum]
MSVLRVIWFLTEMAASAAPRRAASSAYGMWRWPIALPALRHQQTTPTAAKRKIHWDSAHDPTSSVSAPQRLIEGLNWWVKPTWPKHGAPEPITAGVTVVEGREKRRDPADGVTLAQRRDTTDKTNHTAWNKLGRGQQVTSPAIP